MSSERGRFIDAWAEKVKGGEWREEHDRFINAQVQQANDFYKRFLDMKGEKRFKELTGTSDRFVAAFKEANKNR